MALDNIQDLVVLLANFKIKTQFINPAWYYIQTGKDRFSSWIYRDNSATLVKRPPVVYSHEDQFRIRKLFVDQVDEFRKKSYFRTVVTYNL